ncbi:MAG: hypothetical protein HOP12_03410 [Candidatus Eisenbacteria bacterium]|uniref:Carboxypeptidase regulatory-like domain-containing protein n=1 Tax=Eiseniibacteriota bacterium TaxID=2212470 RepID=A0A849SBZ6_UNCEI|nr:hypothetical protein [Candidatus Eisenbacteria bacterium]
MTRAPAMPRFAAIRATLCALALLPAMLAARDAIAAPQVEVHGTVLRPDGAPVPRARITLRNGRSASVSADAQGRFTIRIALPTLARLSRDTLRLQLDAAARGWRPVYGDREPALGLSLTVTEVGGGRRLIARSNDSRLAAVAARAVATGVSLVLDEVRFTALAGERAGVPPPPILTHSATLTLEGAPGNDSTLVKPVAVRPRVDSLQRVVVERERTVRERANSERAERSRTVRPRVDSLQRVVVERERTVRERANSERAERSRRDSLERMQWREAVAAREDSLRAVWGVRRDAPRNADPALIRRLERERIDSTRTANTLKRRESARRDSLRWADFRMAKQAREDSVARLEQLRNDEADAAKAAKEAQRVAQAEARVKRNEASKAARAERVEKAKPPREEKPARVAKPRVEKPIAAPPTPVARTEPPRTEPPVADGCSCRMAGTVEIAPRMVLLEPERVVVRLAGRATPADTLEMFMGAPRAFRLAAVPCGARRLEIIRLRLDAPEARLVDGQPAEGFGCSSGTLLQPRLVIALDRPRNAIRR